MAEGYSSIDEIANTSTEELNKIEGFEEELSAELKEEHKIMSSLKMRI